MLVSFAATNFRSIYERQQVSFIATKYAGMPESVFHPSAVRNGVLPLLAIYGANASGKTNILRALFYLQHFVRSSYAKWEPGDDLPTDPHFFHEDEPTTLECTFIWESRLYVFSFTYDRDQILKEKLRQGSRVVYSRTKNRLYFGSEIGDFTDLRKNLRNNALFISTAAQANHPLLKGIHAWFASWDTVTEDRRHDEEFMGSLILRKKDFADFFVKIISAINPEIIEVVPPDEINKERPSSINPKLRKKLDHREAWSKIKFIHSSEDGTKTAHLLLPEESKGTQSYFALSATIWHTLVEGGFLLLDEADQSLHPSLLRAVVDLFQSPRTNPNKAQVLLNTHETTLLSPDVLRPDQVWFVEKACFKNSEYYCLADFRGIRSDTKAQRAYLEGRFGAVPFVEDHARIFRQLLGLEKELGRNAKKTSTT
jgi:AAA15 family ATPase/GTPase